MKQHRFNKYLLSAIAIVERYKVLIPLLLAKYPDLKIVFTVSPVKHLRDGIVENSRSKAVLLTAVHELVDFYSNCYYFPAFELVNDDLRDYRFYEEDLAHPNAMAVNYVWEKFSGCFFTETTIKLIQRIDKLIAMQQHKALFPESDEHQRFVSRLLEELNNIERETGIKLNRH